jgi:tetratricopeptide (TPR) repeat protein
LPIALVLLVMLAFMPALTAGKVGWDDDDLLDTHTHYHALTADNLHWMFTTSYSGHFQPLTWLSYALDYALWERNPIGYHFTNVVLHALAAVAFYFVARRLLAAAARNRHGAGSWPILLSAAFAATVFAAHPLRAESVAWLAERRDVLSGLLYVLAVGLYLRYAVGRASDNSEPGLGGRARLTRLSYVGAVLACLLSLLAKASAMTLPFVLLIIDIYPLRRLGGSAGWWKETSRPVWLEKLPFLVLAVAGGVRALIAQQAGGDVYSLAEHDLLARFAQACYGLTFYLWKTILPTSLGPLYQIPRREVLLGFMFWRSLVVVIALVFVAVRFRRSRPGIAAALAAYLIVLSPVLGFAQSGPQLVADRYSYLSCLGLALLAGGLLLRGLRPDSWWARRDRQPLLPLVVAGVIAALFHATFSQARIWDSTWSLWSHGVRVSPDSSVAHVNYADALVNRRDVWDLQEAVDHYQRGLELDPEDAIAHDHLARVYRMLRYTDPAIAGFTRALELDPHRPGAHRALAELLIDKGEPVKAMQVLRKGAHDNPRDLGTIDYMAQLLSAYPDEQVRNGAEAVKWAQYVSAANEGKNPLVLATLASAYAEAADFDKALETATRALEIAQRTDNKPLIGELERRRELFRDHKPFRLSPRG